ncbi:hypothetical protein DL98DRAFT_598142 [Cadophora sp. DSE1049]|nr:hypothetical protein DL98DRAFT_598142 [Cadophora sp. DSE1049]
MVRTYSKYKRSREAPGIWTIRGTLGQDFVAVVLATNEHGETIMTRDEQATSLRIPVDQVPNAILKIRTALDELESERAMRLSNLELAKLIKNSPGERNRKAPYAWRSNGKLAKEYVRIAAVRDPETGAFILNKSQRDAALTAGPGARTTTSQAREAPIRLTSQEEAANRVSNPSTITSPPSVLRIPPDILGIDDITASAGVDLPILELAELARSPSSNRSAVAGLFGLPGECLLLSTLHWSWWTDSRARQ